MSRQISSISDISIV